MLFNQDMMDELNVLTRFNLTSMREGIKVHTDADPAVIAAARRLYDKGILSQFDGGYLTDLGLEATELAEKLLSILTSRVEAGSTEQ
ncbi:MAG: TIGR02647 family protein [Gammaproteobacteria bacterium]|nr:TIGR02647 family protein [Gammaproteobacteria bacterium]MDH5653904.1 TIGR02647 family protein [Gammaproteobacteria bacterium]